MPNGLIDMHTHILPGVDDGAKNEAMTRNMLEDAYKHDTRLIFATPHHHPARGLTDKETLIEAYKKTCAIANEISPDLKVLLGMEILYTHDTRDELRNNKLLSLNDSKVLLVEFNHDANYEYIYKALRDLQLSGYEIILAHIERYMELLGNLDYAYNIYDLGIHIQVNASSITGENGLKTKSFVKKLLRDELVWCVGSDAHNTDKRRPVIKHAYDYVCRKYGNEYADEIFKENMLGVKKNESTK